MMTSQNKKFFKGEFYRLLITAAVLCGASAARAASTNEFAVIDIMETVRQSEVESSITVA